MIPLPGPKTSAPCVLSLTLSGAIAVTNALVTSLATAVTPTVLTGVGFTGALGAGPVAFATPLSRSVSVTTSAHAGSYKVGAPNAIVVTGTDESGAVVAESLALVATNGGETIKGTQLFATITEIDIPAQNDALGAFTFGVNDVGFPYTREITVGTHGTLHVFYGATNESDTIPDAVVTVRPTLPINVTKIFGDSTSQNVTVFF